MKKSNIKRNAKRRQSVKESVQPKPASREITVDDVIRDLLALFNSTVLKTCLFSILSQSLQLLQEVCGGQEPGIAV